MLDDFGTGYSSLAYLTRLPLDALKVDRSFIDGLGTEPRDTAITEAIVAMSHALSLEVVGEGAETDLQVAELTRASAATTRRAFTSRARCRPAEITAMLQHGPAWLARARLSRQRIGGVAAAAAARPSPCRTRPPRRAASTRSVAVSLGAITCSP